MPYQKINLSGMIVCCFLVGSCFLLPDPRYEVIKKQSDEINLASQQAAQEAEDNKSTTMYVYSDDGAWICPTKAQALQNQACQEGFRLTKGEELRVIGQGPQDGVWRATTPAFKGDGSGYVSAELINELPQTVNLDDFVAKTNADIPETKRISYGNINFADLILHNKTYRNKKLVLVITSNAMENLDIANKRLTFALPVPSKPGSEFSSYIQFQFPNDKWVNEFINGQKSYSCGRNHCDKLGIVARLESKPIEQVNEFGQVHRMPLFTIEKLVDRYGQYP